MLHAEQPDGVGKRQRILILIITTATSRQRAHFAAADVLDEPAVAADHRPDVCVLLIKPGLYCDIHRQTLPRLIAPLAALASRGSRLYAAYFVVARGGNNASAHSSSARRRAIRLDVVHFDPGQRYGSGLTEMAARNSRGEPRARHRVPSGSPALGPRPGAW
jgi:hypothetical protein